MAEAVEFIGEFPGAVWDLHDDCESSPNYRTGVDTQVTLHVADRYGWALERAS